MPVPAETGFIELKGWCPFKFENKTSAAKWQSMSCWLKPPLLTHLSFRRTLPLNSHFWTNWRSAAKSFLLPIFSCPLRCASIIGTAIFTALSGEVQQKKIPRIIVISVANAPRLTNRHGECAARHLKAQGSAGDYILYKYYWLYMARTAWLIFFRTCLIIGQLWMKMEIWQI